MFADALRTASLSVVTSKIEADICADHIHQNLRFAAIAPVAFEPLRDQKTEPVESFVFDCRSQSAVDASQTTSLFNNPQRPATRGTICRSRVNVSGVVTPSPVGVAMLKLR